MKDEVPPALIDAHVKTVEKAVSEGKEITEGFGLEQTGIAGTLPEKDESAEKKKDEEKEKEKKDEAAEKPEEKTKQSEEKVRGSQIILIGFHHDCL